MGFTPFTRDIAVPAHSPSPCRIGNLLRLLLPLILITGLSAQQKAGEASVPPEHRFDVRTAHLHGDQYLILIAIEGAKTEAVYAAVLDEDSPSEGNLCQATIQLIAGSRSTHAFPCPLTDHTILRLENSSNVLLAVNDVRQDSWFSRNRFALILVVCLIVVGLLALTVGAAFGLSDIATRDAVAVKADLVRATDSLNQITASSDKLSGDVAGLHKAHDDLLRVLRSRFTTNEDWAWFAGISLLAAVNEFIASGKSDFQSLDALLKPLSLTGKLCDLKQVQPGQYRIRFHDKGRWLTCSGFLVPFVQPRRALPDNMPDFFAISNGASGKFPILQFTSACTIRAITVDLTSVDPVPEDADLYEVREKGLAYWTRASAPLYDYATCRAVADFRLVSLVTTFRKVADLGQRTGDLSTRVSGLARDRWTFAAAATRFACWQPRTTEGTTLERRLQHACNRWIETSDSPGMSPCLPDDFDWHVCNISRDEDVADRFRIVPDHEGRWFASGHPRAQW